MFANAKALVIIVSCALVAYAQDTTTATAPASQPTLDTCITNCLTTALTSSTCTSYTDLTCVCTSTDFQQAAATCLSAQCTADDLSTATSLFGQECSGISASGSVPASTAASTAASSGTPTSAAPSGTSTSAASTGTSKSAASSGTSASATPSATSSSAAVALSAPFSLGSLVGTFVASAGALVGAVFVL